MPASNNHYNGRNHEHALAGSAAARETNKNPGITSFIAPSNDRDNMRQYGNELSSPSKLLDKAFNRNAREHDEQRRQGKDSNEGFLDAIGFEIVLGFEHRLTTTPLNAMEQDCLERLLKAEKLQTWLSAAKSEVLFINGLAGPHTNRPLVLSVFMERLYGFIARRKPTPQTPLLLWYCGPDKPHSPRNMCMNLVGQLLKVGKSQVPMRFHSIDAIGIEASIELLVYFIEEQLRETAVILLIDSIDYNERDPSQNEDTKLLLKQLNSVASKSLVSGAHAFKLLVTSSDFSGNMNFLSEAKSISGPSYSDGGYGAV